MIDLIYLKRRALVHSRMKQAPQLSSSSDPTAAGMAKNAEQAWRKYGQARRREIVEHDVLEGGNQFEINKDCLVENYFKLAERVVQQFRTMFESPNSFTLEKTYIMGHRLVAFLSEALPSHPEYMSQSMEQHRSSTIRDLMWIHRRLEEIALQIDEEQLNRYITDEYEPEHDDDEESTTCSTASSSGEDLSSQECEAATGGRLGARPQQLTHSSGGWESFEGWSLGGGSLEEAPHLIESDTSMNSSKDTASLDDAPEFGASVSFPDESILEHASSLEEISESYCSDPDIDMDLLDDEDSVDVSYVCTPRVDLYEIQQAVRSSTFLRQIAKQDVVYEWDTDASDSWAQEKEEDFSDCESKSSDGIFCDPPRLALREMGQAEQPHVELRHLAKSRTFDDDMPDDEATCSGSCKSQSSNYSFANGIDAPDDEAGLWASFDITSPQRVY